MSRPRTTPYYQRKDGVMAEVAYVRPETDRFLVFMQTDRISGSVINHRDEMILAIAMNERWDLEGFPTFELQGACGNPLLKPGEYQFFRTFIATEFEGPTRLWHGIECPGAILKVFREYLGEEELTCRTKSAGTLPPFPFGCASITAR